MGKTYNVVDVDDFKGRIEPGVEEVKFVGVEEKTNKNGKDFVEFAVVTTDGKLEHTEEFYFSTENGIKMSLRRIKHMINELLGEGKLSNEFQIDDLRKLFVGQKARIKFDGKAYLNADQEIRVKAKFAFAGFIENLNVPKAETRLHFDKEKDIDYSEISPSMKDKMNNGSSDSTDEELSF